MKKYETIYSDTGVTYWPMYKAGKISIVYFSAIATVSVVLALWILFDNATTDSKIVAIVLAVVSAILLLIFYKYFLKTRYTKYSVTDTEVLFSNSYTKEEKQIKWQDVSAVYFKQDIWWHRKSCIITLKNSDCEKPNKKKLDDFVLPISMIDEKKLLQFIPKDLWQNNPS